MLSLRTRSIARAPSARNSSGVCIRLGSSVNKPRAIAAFAGKDEEVYRIVKVDEANGTISVADTPVTARSNESLIGSIMVSMSAVFLGCCILYAANHSAAPSLPTMPAPVAVTTAAPQAPEVKPVFPAPVAAPAAVVKATVAPATTISTPAPVAVKPPAPVFDFPDCYTNVC